MKKSEAKIARIHPIPIPGRIAKRLFDLTLSMAGLLCVLPLFVIIPITIKVTSHGPVFYRANRVGQFGHEFRMFKFRTMTATADSTGPLVTGGRDPRITKVGAWMRKLKIDESPQLFNVLAGSMSVVGPRPQSPKYLEHYGEAGMRSLSVKPGLTSPAMIVSQESLLEAESPEENEKNYLENLLPIRIEHDLNYVDTWSFMGDVRCTFRTAWAMVATDATRRKMPIGS